MPVSYDVFFVSSNIEKYNEAKVITTKLGIKLGFIRYPLEEIQSTILEISKRKASDAFKKFGKPVLVEDDGLFIDDLGGFPGPFSSYTFERIGNEGILRLLDNNRTAKFVSVISFCYKDVLKSFQAELPGNISKSPKGSGWGYDPIFIPYNTNQTFAQIDKNVISHRFLALQKFANWHKSFY